MTLELPVETRVTNLEELMAQLTTLVIQQGQNINRLELKVERLSDEMREFKDEMREFKDESQRTQKQMNKQWGDLSNKMGTLAEDLVAPSIGRILHMVIDCPEEQIDTIAIRVRQRRPSDNHPREFDAIAVCGNYLLINETKSNLRSEDIAAFTQILTEVRTYFPEYADKKVIGSVASLYVNENLVQYGERLGLIVLGFGEGVMDVLNGTDFQPKEF